MPARNGDIDAIIAANPDGRGAILGRLRGIIHEADPKIVEAVKWRKPSNPLGAAVFEHDGIVCLMVPLKGRVRLSFAQGADLPDPKGLFNAQLNGRSRAIDFPVGGKLDRPGVKALVRAAVTQRTGTKSATGNVAKQKPAAKKAATTKAATKEPPKEPKRPKAATKTTSEASSDAVRLEAAIDAYSPAVAKLGRAVLDRMRALVPGTIEVVYDYRKNLLVSFSPTGKGYQASFTVVFYPTKIDLALLHGATMKDPQRLLQGKGKQIRSVQVQDVKDLERPGLRALIEQELAEAPSWDKSRPRQVIMQTEAADREPRRV